MNWTERAKESFFDLIDEDQYKNDRVNTQKVRCGPSTIVPGELGVFARQNLKKGEVIEWGVATLIPGIDVRSNDHLFTWDSLKKDTAATVSGCGLYYNTLGDASNARCVPYHAEKRFEVYALREIRSGEELTFRYDSMNYREGMAKVKDIVGELRGGDQFDGREP
ncbi:hypothetical protein MK280_06010 [Myxococcota bacterium]|nr:hypothetical protein [Myxococcota bacterium]